MYKEHPEFDPPTGNPLLWRYMDFAKFISLIEHSSLYFIRVDKLSDKFEGAPSKPYLDEFYEFYTEVPENLMQKVASSFKSGRRFVLVNCWCENTSELDSMWRKFTEGRYGVAVQTDLESLKSSFICEEDIHIGKVKYVDYDSEYIRQDAMFPRYLHKRDLYKDEQEIRVIAVPFPFKLDSGRLIEEICEVGQNFEVDIKLLIRKVIVSPRAPDWFFELVRVLLLKYGIESAVESSRLADIPAW